MGARVLKSHYNEPGSLMEDQDHKGFVRFRFANTGDVEMFVLAVKRTPRHWRESDEHTETAQRDNPSLFVGADVPLELDVVERVYIKSGRDRSGSVAVP